MRKEKLPTEEGKDSGYFEIPLPNFTKAKDSAAEKLEQVSDAIGNDGRKYVARDISTLFEKGRVGLDPGLARAGIGLGLGFVVFAILGLIAHAPLWLYGFFALAWLLCMVLVFLGKYEIRFDDHGFDICLGKKVLRHHSWSEVTDVADKNKVCVNGKRLFVDPSMQGFADFYHRARVACKGNSGKTVPSVKKQKQRKKK